MRTTPPEQQQQGALTHFELLQIRSCAATNEELQQILQQIQRAHNMIQYVHAM